MTERPVNVTDERPGLDETVALYESVGWTAYASDPASLAAAIRGSALVLTARTDAGALVGLARTISDGASIVYLQDLLVHPAHQLRGIGGALLDGALRRADGIRQFVLLTDDEPAQRAFYESRGLVEVHDVQPHPLRSFVRFARL